MVFTGVAKKAVKKAVGKSTGKGKGGSPGEESGDSSRKVYVGSLAYKTSWRGLKDHFAQIGTVTYTKVLTHFGVPGVAQRDGWSKGTGLVEFETAREAYDAIATLNNSELDGREIFVDAWDASGDSKVQDQAGKGKSKTASIMAKASAFAKSFGKGGFGGKAGFGKKGKGGKGGGDFKKADPTCKVYVGSLAYSTNWGQLKDHMSQAGDVVYCKVLTDAAKSMGKSANRDGWSKGTGLVEYATPGEAENAISLLNESELGGRNIRVEMWA